MKYEQSMKRASGLESVFLFEMSKNKLNIKKLYPKNTVSYSWFQSRGIPKLVSLLMAADVVISKGK